MQKCLLTDLFSTILNVCVTYYRRNQAVIRSDNISTICILKDVLTKEATKKSMRLELACGMIIDYVCLVSVFNSADC